MAHLQIAILFPVILRVSLLVLMFCYFLLFIIILYGWNKSTKTAIPAPKSLPTVCVIIAARNEEKNLPLLLNDLRNQDYPTIMTEIIIADDHSDEPISSLVSSQALYLPNLRIIRLPERLYGKKNALLYAASFSNSDMLLFTDADCRLNQGWIRSFARYYTNNKPALIIGLVDYTDCKRMIQKIFHLEFIALVVSGAGTAALGFPTLCNGANLAVDRKLYLSLSNELLIRFPSGDDVFLLHAVKHANIGPIYINRVKSSLVRTIPPDTFRKFMNQRARWISKSTDYYDSDTLFGNLALLAGLIDSLLTGRFMLLFIIFCTKTMADCLVTGAGLSYFGGIHNILLIPIFEILYPFYMLVTSLRGLMQFYSWKGRPHPDFIPPA